MPLGEVEFPIAGAWTSSNKAFVRCFGVLRRGDDGSLCLDLFGLRANAIRASFENPEVTIWGDTERYKNITLLHCFFRKGPPINLDGPTFHMAEVVVNDVILGMHLRNERERAITHCVVRSQAILDWSSEKLLSIDRKKGFDGPSLRTGRGKRFVVKTAEWSLLVRHNFTYSILERETGAFNITHHAEATIEFDGPRSLADAKNTVRSVEGLFAFLSSNFSAKSLLFLTATSRSGRPRQAMVLPPRDYKTEGEPVDPWHRLAPQYVCEAGTTRRLLKNWFKSIEKIQLAVDFYRSYMETPTFTVAKFQVIVQALEILHRETSKSALCSPQYSARIRKKMLAALPSNIPGEVHSKIESTLTYIGELSLRQRLKDLAEEFGFVLPKNMTSKSAVSRIVDTRNRLTHGGLRNSQFAAIPHLTMICGALFEAKLLSILGAKPEEVRKLFGRIQDERRRPDWYHPSL